MARGPEIISDICAFSSQGQEAGDLAYKIFHILSDQLCFQGDALRGESGGGGLPPSLLKRKKALDYLTEHQFPQL